MSKKAKNTTKIDLDPTFELMLLATAVLQSADAVMITDSNGKILFVNPAFELICGYTKEEVVGKTPGFLSSKLHKPAFYKRIWEELRAGKIFKDTFVNKRKDGSLYYLDQVITPVLSPDNKIRYFVSTGRDITNQREAQFSLEASERQKRAILDTVPDLIFLVSIDGRIKNVYGNIQGFKVTPELIKNKLLGDILPRQVSNLVGTMIKKVISSGTPAVSEYMLLEHVRHPGIYEIRFVKSGDYECLCMVRNITEKKELIQKQSLYEFIVNTTQDDMVMIDREHRYVAVNDAYCSSHGKTREEILGKKVEEIWPNDTYDRYLKNYLKDCFRGNKVKAQLWLSFSNNEKSFRDLTYYPYKLNSDKITHAIVIAHDLTDRKIAEEKIKQLYDEQKVLFSEIAHTLKTPLTVLMGSIDSLEKPIDIETRKELISMMRQNILGVSKNITSLLKVAKMDMLQGELALSNVDLKHVLETIAKQTRLLYQSIYTGCDWEVIKRNCKITPLQKSIVINTDEVKLKEVLLIVIENALLHSPKDENLPVVRMSVKKKKGYVIIEVQDFGKGMIEDEVRNAFVLYHRGSSKKPGFGIGLAYAYKVVSNLNGEIIIQSEKGIGTTVSIKLPI